MTLTVFMKGGGMMIKKTKKGFSLLVLSVFLMTMLPATGMAAPADEIPFDKPLSKEYARTKSTAAEIGVDLLLIRPVCLGVTVLGIGGFIVTLPFTLIGQNAGHAAEVFIVEPGKYTFTHPLGSY